MWKKRTPSFIFLLILSTSTFTYAQGDLSPFFFGELMNEKNPSDGPVIEDVVETLQGGMTLRHKGRAAPKDLPPNTDKRLSHAHVFGKKSKYGQRQLEKALVTVLLERRDVSPRTIKNAISSLGLSDSEYSAEALRSMYDYAPQYAKEIVDKEVAPDLHHLRSVYLRDPEEALRLYNMRTIPNPAWEDEKRRKSAILTEIQDIRLYVLWAIKKRGVEQFQPTILKAYQDEDSTLATAAEQILGAENSVGSEKE